MPVDVVLGLQWGDEGKGKVVDMLAERADVVARYQGGPNAGHTVVHNGQKHVLHMVPSGIVHGRRCLIGPGCVVDPSQMLNEYVALRHLGLDPRTKVGIDVQTPLITPEMRLMDALRESRTGGFGSTKTGIAFAYAAEAAKKAARIYDIVQKGDSGKKALEKIVDDLIDDVEAKVLQAWRLTRTDAITASDEITKRDERVYKGLFGDEKTPGVPGIKRAHLNFGRFIDPFSESVIFRRSEIVEYLLKMGEKLREYGAVTDVFKEIQNVLESDAMVIAEGSQGIMLHLLQGTRPYTTSSFTGVDGALAGLGIAPHQLGNVIGVMKAYVTRVGDGPFPTWNQEDIGAFLQDRGSERGATTGRSRKCGFFDAVQARYALQRTGAHEIALTKLDILAGISELKICVAYRIGKKVIDYFPRDDDTQKAAVPIWSKPFKPFGPEEVIGAKSFDDLGPNARAYVNTIMRHIQPACPHVRLKYIGTGPDRDDLIILEKPLKAN